MTKQKTTKKTLLTSVLSLVLCMAMLIGTTFAWFTDSVTSGKNRIQAGNLDVAMSYKNTSMKDYEDVEKPTSPDFFKDINGDQILWEPGAVAYANFKVDNLGTLALKYSLQTIIAGCNYTAEGKSLADVLTVKVMPEEKTYTTRELAIADAKGSTDTLESFAHVNDNLVAKKSDYFTVILYWEPGANDNDFNVNPALYIDIELSLVATQAVNEEDSFNQNYDKYTAVFTVAEANAMLLEGKDVALVNCNEPKGVLEVPENYTGTLTLHNVAIASVQKVASVSTLALTETNTVETKAIKIVVSGNVVVKATADGMSAITGTSLDISGTGTLTAVGKGKAAFGIGGLNTKEISIKNVHIADVKGGCVQPLFENDLDYGKSEPEGGAAIGSAYKGAVINLTGVTIDNAQGGSKAAGIGARYHTGVTINIADCVIKNVEGGNASAGIGGSRVSDDVAPADQHVKINIENSTINATGGQFGAGIGSGYDTHCGGKGMINETICTINIDGQSTITAQGGKYAAGVGTGYHVAALAGKINCEVNATAGESREKYTMAQNVGFGVVDHAREVSYLSQSPTLTYQGTVIGVPDAPARVNDAKGLSKAVADGKTSLWLNPGEYNVSDCKNKTLTISGTKDAVIKVYNEGEDGCDYGFDSSNVTFNGVTIDTTANTGNYKGYARLNATFNDCKFFGAYTSHTEQTFNNCYFDFNNGYFWIWGAKEVNFNNCEFGGNSKNILAHGWESSVININGCKFAATAKGYASGGTVWTAAVEIDPAGTNTYTINFIGKNTINENYAGWTRIKDNSTGHTISGLN